MPSFDPYQEWLGVRPEDQPPNFYQLLGIMVFESDSRKISVGFGKQMAHLDSLKGSEDAGLVAEISKEVRTAFDCLNDDERKATYDKQLSYQEWLGILPKDQPPNYSQLLGVELFESDFRKISHGASKQKSRLKRLPKYDQVGLTREILNEISRAEEWLVNSERKVVYDKRLSYQVWLGISPGDQPPNHYQLLELNPYESDTNVISLAIEKQVNHLQARQLEHPRLVQRLLDETSIAKKCLLNAETKAAYDKRLGKIGILLIHGIGQQTRGGTLSQVGDALQNWLDKMRLNPRITYSVLINDDPTKFSPANAHLELTTDGTKREWLLAEGFWADAILAPQFSDVLQWSFKAVPTTLLIHCGHVVQRWLDSLFQRKRDLFSWLLFQSAIIPSSILAVTILLVLMPVISIFLLALLLLSLVPIASVRNFVDSLQRTLSQTIGDSAVLLDSQIQSAAIISRAHRAYEWLAESCERVAIVGHSQGASVAHTLLKTRSCDKTRMLATVGSGLRKLKTLEKATHEGTYLLWVASFSVLVVVAGFLGLLHQAPAGAFRAGLFALFAGLLIPALFVQISVVLNSLVSRLFDIYDKTKAFVLRRIFQIPPPPPRDQEGCLPALIQVFEQFLRALMIAVIAWLITAILLVTAYIVIMNLFLGKGLLLKITAGLIDFFLVTAIVALNLWDPKLVEVFPERSAGVSWIQKVLLLQAVQPSERVTSHFSNALWLPIRWIDVYSRRDPVPNGPFVDVPIDKDENFELQPVQNRSSLLFDHTSYWNNQEQCITTLIKEFLRLDGVRAIDDERAREISTIRDRRVGMLKLSRAMLFICFALVSITWWKTLVGEIDVWRPKIALLVSYVPLIGNWLKDAAQPAQGSPQYDAYFAFGIVVLAGISFYLIVWALWSHWDKIASLRFNDENPNGQLFSRATLIVSIFTVVLATTILIVHRIALAVDIDLFSWLY
jgi:hypothetical protein